MAIVPGDQQDRPALGAAGALPGRDWEHRRHGRAADAPLVSAKESGMGIEEVLESVIVAMVPPSQGGRKRAVGGADFRLRITTTTRARSFLGAGVGRHGQSRLRDSECFGPPDADFRRDGGRCVFAPVMRRSDSLSRRATSGILSASDQGPCRDTQVGDTITDCGAIRAAEAAAGLQRGAADGLLRDLSGGRGAHTRT